MFYCMFVAFTCDCINGYDGSVMSSVLAMSHFQSYFGAGKNLNTSVIFSIYTAGSMISAPMVSETRTRRYGKPHVTRVPLTSPRSTSAQLGRTSTHFDLGHIGSDPTEIGQEN